MKIVVLDRLTLGEDLDISGAGCFGELVSYDSTLPEEVEHHIGDAEIVFVNKVRLCRDNLKNAVNLKLICEAATGFDNIDVDYCRENGIAVCNVPGYSVYSVAQVTVSMVLYLVNHLKEYTGFTSDGTYTDGGCANILTPLYHELWGKTWGIVGYGGIGSKVGDIARALGCRVIAYKRTPAKNVECTDIDTLVEQSDIITIHIPLNEETKNLINKERISQMKPGAVVVNTARGLVTDEKALCEAVKNGRIAGFGTDVYSKEPFDEESPFFEIKDHPNVCFTPHMAWGTVEARNRCFDEMIKNTHSFLNGEKRNRID